MNRAEYRRQQKKEAKWKQAESRTMTQYEKGRNEGYLVGYKEGIKETTGNAIRLITTGFAVSLRSEYKFGHDRMKRILDMVHATFEDVLEDPEHEQKLREWLKREINIDLDDYTGCRRMDIAEDICGMRKVYGTEGRNENDI